MTNKQGLKALFERVAKRLESPERWTQGAYARDSAGVVVDPFSTAAVCW